MVWVVYQDCPRTDPMQCFFCSHWYRSDTATCFDSILPRCLCCSSKRPQTDIHLLQPPSIGSSSNKALFSVAPEDINLPNSAPAFRDATINRTHDNVSLLHVSPARCCGYEYNITPVQCCPPSMAKLNISNIIC